MMMRMRLFFTALMIVCFYSGWVSAQNGDAEEKSLHLEMVGHSHIDPVYRWRWNEVRDRNLDFTFNRVLNVMDVYPGFTFSQSQLLFYESIKENNPPLFKKVKEKIDKGQWSVVGGQWVEPDEVLTSGESMIRQFLVAHDFYNRNLGIEDINIAWAPDAFTGHANTIPQIYSGCGIKYYVIARSPPKDKRVFWWQGPDDSRILTYKIPGHYKVDFNNFVDTARYWSGVTNYNHVMKTFGEGDHGGGPTVDQIEKLKELEQKHADVNVNFTSSEAYFENMPFDQDRWPVYQSELGLKFRGAYTANTGIKRENRRLENKLLTAEKFATIGCMYHRKPFFPRQDFLESWKILLKNQVHDVLPGTMVSLAADDAYKDYQKLATKTDELLTYGLELIGSRIDTRMEGKPLVVYNPHSWEVSDFVDAEIRFVEKPDEFKILGPEQNEVFYEINSWSEDKKTAQITLNAKDVPGIGYKTYEVVKEAPDFPSTHLVVNENRIENDFYFIEWDEEGLTRLYNKTLDRDMLSGKGNALKILNEKAGSSTSWSLNLTEVQTSLRSMEPPRITQKSPMRVKVKWQDRTRSSKFIRTMTVKAGSPQIDFGMEVDWHENNKLLRVSFPVMVDNGQAYYEQPYGYIQRPLSNKENPAQKWVDLSNENYGVALINNGKNGFVINNSSIDMSVVRGPQGMDPRMDEGIHTFNYSLIVHEGDWKTANLPKKARVFNQKLQSLQENYHSGKTNAWYTGNTTLPLSHSFYNIDSDHVIISSVKVKRDEYNPARVVLRVFETEGKGEEVTVNLPHTPDEIIECNHIEEPIDPKSEITKNGDEFSFKIGHNQIRTFLLKY